jgi:hypothetical protein
MWENHNQKKKINLVEKNEALVLVFSFSLIPNRKQHLRLPSWWLLFRNPKMEPFKNQMEVLWKNLFNSSKRKKREKS